MANNLDRRDFLGLAALGSLGTAFGRSPVRAASARLSASVPFTIGIATYSLRNFSRAEAIQMIQAIGATHVSVKSFHLPYDASPAELAAGAQEFADAGLQIVSGGNNNIREDDDDHVRMFFEYARAAGIPMLVIAPTVEIMPRIEKFVKQYNIRVAIHNHGPEDDYFPGPADALKVIKRMDPRVGLCIDIGHTARTGVDVVKAIADAGDRVLDLHAKDLRDLRERDSQCIVGEGAMPIAGIFRQLQKMNYRGSVHLEYEIDADDPLAGMQRSFAYMRGVAAGLDA